MVKSTDLPFWKDPLVAVAALAAVLFWLVLGLATQPQTDLTWPLTDPQRFLQLALLYPILEEWVFRGFIQDLAHQHLRAWRLGPLSHANILTSLLFTGLHFFYHPPLWAASVLAPSLLFGFFKDRTGKLTTPILLHVFFNSGYLLIFAA